MRAEEMAGFLLLYAVLPLWVLAGLTDWACHWRTGIEHNAGVIESALHWLMFGLLGTAVLAGLLLRLNAGVLLLCALLGLAHHGVVYAELRFVVSRRVVGPFEQMVHSFMEVLPFTALALLAVLGAEHGALQAPLDWTLQWRKPPLPPSLLVSVALPVLLFNGFPLLQELARTLAVRRLARP